MASVTANRHTSVSFGLVLALTLSATQTVWSQATPSEPAPPQKVAPHLPNAYRLHERVISGGLPEGDAAFKELHDLGVHTVISVDGAQPDVKTAAKYGLRYVHLPHGYDGISAERAAELAKAVRDLPGPVYIHCHHGKHRSPAAAVVACVSTGLLAPESALIVLKTAGTSENYRGLYESAISARRIDDATLDALQAEFPESAKLPAIAEAMIPIEHAHDHLKLFAANSWKKLADKPDLDAPHEALLLREQFTEMLRMPAVAQQPAEFRQLVSDSEAAAESLEAHLRAGRQADAVKSLELVTQKCTACHRAFRDIPLSEKQAK
jgi:cytochrome c556/protein tyrosine phosphatase (PTP) superfamily phosphohydrolase (DUF442 family)